MNKEQKWALILIGTCMLVGVYFTYRTNLQLQKIKKEPKSTFAFLYKYIDNGGKHIGGCSYYYFNLSNNTISNNNGNTSIKKGNAEAFIGHYFPVLYEKNNPKNSKILITPEDFETFNLPYPDSLNWVLQYLYQE